MGTIVSIKRFEIHDGPGIRSTVFLKGCPLRCKWCHNPECIEGNKQINIDWKKCIDCGKCTEICCNHKINNGKHVVDYQTCLACGKCVSVCPNNAISIMGFDIDAENLVKQLLEDKEFFDSSSGGVTISGGEPFMQKDFLIEILKLLKKENIQTAVDTSGLVNIDSIAEVIDYVDIFLYDLKAYTEKKHLECTGVSNKQIKKNFEFLLSNGKKVEVRIPIIPSMNNEEIIMIGEYLKRLKFDGIVKLLPFHNLSKEKYKSLNMMYLLNGLEPLKKEELKEYVEQFKKLGLNAIGGGLDD